MPWKEITTEKLAKKLGVDIAEIREKQSLIDLIKTARKKMGLSQVALAKKAGVSQARIAQIESEQGIARITFDVLFGVLRLLGYDFKIKMRKVA